MKAMGIGCLIFLILLIMYLLYTAVLRDLMGHQNWVKNLTRILTPRWKLRGARALEKKLREEAEKEKAKKNV